MFKGGEIILRAVIYKHNQQKIQINQEYNNSQGCMFMIQFEVTGTLLCKTRAQNAMKKDT